MKSPLRQLTALLLGAGPLLAGAPAQALEQIQLMLPLLETPFTIQLSELRDQRKLLSGDSDLAELDRATDGAIGRRLVEAFQTPLPLPVKAFAEQSVGSPLVNQVLLLISSVVLVEGVRQPLDSSQLATSLESSQAKGSLNLLEVLEALPGKSASVDLQRVVFAIDRLANQQRLGNDLVTSMPAAGISPALSQAGPLAVKRQELAIPVTHRPKPLQVVTIQPETGANGRLVLISHGLWDSPESFEGWGKHLASHGYTVLLPRHPGSDKSQQQAMLSGEVPPPKPEDLKLRPMDMTSEMRPPRAAWGCRPACAPMPSWPWGSPTAPPRRCSWPGPVPVRPCSTASARTSPTRPATSAGCCSAVSSPPPTRRAWPTPG